MSRYVQISRLQSRSFDFRTATAGAVAERCSALCYEQQGKIYADYNKKICQTQYNYLASLTLIQFRYGHQIKYAYDASGVKRTVIVQTNRNPQYTPLSITSERDERNFRLVEDRTDYCGSIIYRNQELEKVLTPEGEAWWDGNGFRYTCHLKDHLGSLRVVKQGQEVTQYYHYYPFGMLMGESMAGDSPYRYNGKEFQSWHRLNWYDYLARPYDSGRGCWPGPAPLAEKYYSVSPYAYCGNNPVNRIDPNGMEWKTKEDEEYANKLSQEMTNKATSEQKSLDKLNAKITKNEAKGKDVSKDQAKAAGMQANIENLNAGVSELTAMGDTKDQVFTYQMVDGDVGKVTIEDGVVVMKIAGNGNTTNGVHESSHGFDVWKSGMPKSIDSFYSTEAKAYGRQFSFGGKSAMPYSEWGSVNGLSNVTTNWIIGITDSNGDYMYPKQLMGDKYNKAQIKSLIFNK